MTCHMADMWQDFFAVFVQIKINNVQLYTSHRKRILLPILSNTFFFFQFVFKLKRNILKNILNDAGGASLGGFTFTSNPCLEAKLCIFDSSVFRARPWLVVGSTFL